MTHSKDPDQLRHIVTQKRREGRLPRITTARAWAGNGSGAVCTVCEFPIEAGEIEYEVEWQNAHAVELLRFHELCYRLCNEL